MKWLFIAIVGLGVLGVVFYDDIKLNLSQAGVYSGAGTQTGGAAGRLGKSSRRNYERLGGAIGR